MGQITLDSTLWPVVLVQFPSTPMSDEALDDYLARLTRLLDNGEHYTTVTDTTRISVSINAKQRARIGQFVEQQATALERWNLGNALVALSRPIRIVGLCQPVDDAHIGIVDLDRPHHGVAGQLAQRLQHSSKCWHVWRHFEQAQQRG